MAEKRKNRRRARVGGRKAPVGELVKFPPLPQPPEPPHGPLDPRQRTSRQIIGGLMDALGGSSVAIATNTRAGFPAASVDLGRLKAALETGISRMNMRQVRERWDDDLRDWMFRVVIAWVQRCKHTRIEPRELGIAVQLETQDDLGYYEYRFSVMPGRDDDE